jgi:PAS domain S-box-containing protein
MWIFDLENQEFLEVNKAAVSLYGFEPEEFRGMHLRAIVGDEEVRSLMTGHSAPSLGVHRTKAGNLIDVNTAIHEITYGGRKAGLAVLMDVTERLRLEEQLRQAQKMEAVGMLAGGIAHDFNNLLTIITGYSQLIFNGLQAGDPNRHSAEQIVKAGERAAELTRQLLAFSRRQVLQPKVLDLNLLRRLIGEHIDLRLVLDPELSRVSASPGQLEQVLMNLVVNARDAMPDGGTLTILTENTNLKEASTGQLLAAKAGPHVMLAVSDTGHGMDAATRARVFEPFFTTKHAGKGTGLGLSTVFGIVKQSGGSLDVRSEPGKGTTMKIYLPAVDQPVAAEAEMVKRAGVRGHETILVVEDDEMVRRLVRQTLEQEGYRLMDAPEPVEACRIAEAFKGPIQLLITDVVMPNSSGRELAAQIVHRRPETKVLYMSGYADLAFVNRGAEPSNFLQKPFTPATLTQQVRDVLASDNGKVRRAGG